MKNSMHAEDGLQLERNPLHIRAEDELKTNRTHFRKILPESPSWIHVSIRQRGTPVPGERRVLIRCEFSDSKSVRIALSPNPLSVGPFGPRPSRLPLVGGLCSGGNRVVFPFLRWCRQMDFSGGKGSRLAANPCSIRQPWSF